MPRERPVRSFSALRTAGGYRRQTRHSLLWIPWLGLRITYSRRRRSSMAVPEELKLALEHSRDMFKYHADQRHTSLNYYFVALAAFVTAFVALLNGDSVWKASSFVRIGTRPVIAGKLLGSALGGVAIAMTLLFLLLDNRNRELVEADKRLLARAELGLAEHYLIPEFEIIQCSEASKNARWMSYQSYRCLVPAMLLAYSLLWVA